MLWPWCLTWSPKLVVLCHAPSTTCANFQQNRFIRFWNIVFTSLETEERTDGRTSGQVENIMRPASIDWRMAKKWVSSRMMNKLWMMITLMTEQLYILLQNVRKLSKQNIVKVHTVLYVPKPGWFVWTDRFELPILFFNESIGIDSANECMDSNRYKDCDYEWIKQQLL